jgi:hypothetical protein
MAWIDSIQVMTKLELQQATEMMLIVGLSVPTMDLVDGVGMVMLEIVL